jgi:dCTP deaminase
MLHANGLATCQELRMGHGLRTDRAGVLDLEPGAAGVLPNQYLERAVDAGIIRAAGGVPTDNIQPASLDLRLGEVAYRIRCSFLPASQTVRQKLKGLVLDEVPLGGKGAVLTPGYPYLVPLKEELELPPGLRARANPKSSTGRADVFTRVITDGSYRFDDIVPGYRGKLYLEVVPLSFPVLLREDLTLNQLRLSVGRTSLRDDQISDFHMKQPLIFADGNEVPVDELNLSDGLFLGLDLSPRGRAMGYSARQNPPLLDMTQIGEADPKKYWDSIPKAHDRSIILTPKVFYLLMSYEAVTIPPTLAAEMTAYDPTSGELRTHYAGFFDPGFGYDEGNRFQGSTAALEVRAHDVAFMIEHRQPVCKLTFESMLEEPTSLYGKGIGSNYQRQTETLGKHFKSRSVEAATASTADEPPEQLELISLAGA